MNDILYKKNVNNSLQQWFIEVEGDKLRTSSGKVGGKLTVSKWTTCHPKNVGRANATTGEEQAIREAASKRQKKIDKGYFETQEEALNSDIFRPMLARTFREGQKFDEVVSVQPKLDGIRLCLTKDKVVAARSNKPIFTVPHIVDYSKEFFKQYPDLILDGELYSDELSQDFEKIVSLARKIKPSAEDLELSKEYLKLYVYDIYDKNRPGMTFVNRYGRLKFLALQHNFVKGKPISILTTDMADSAEELDKLHAQYIGSGAEGSMIRLNMAYEQKRSKGLLKRKSFLDAEYEILEVKEGKGSWQGMAKSISFVTGYGTPFDAGIKGTQEYCRDLLLNKDKYIGEQATVVYQNLTAYGVPRFPVVHAIHVGGKL